MTPKAKPEAAADSEGDVPRTVALAWGIAEFPQKGPKRELNHERIVAAAIALADEEGLEAVTMQRVAQTFGFTTMALYRYIATKRELHELMFDAALSDQEQPPIEAEDWRAGLLEWAGELLNTYRRHPWLLDITMKVQSLVMPSQIRMADGALRLLASLPMTDGERLGVILSVSVFVRGYAETIRQVTASGGLSAATKDMVTELVTPDRFPGIAPLIASGVYLDDAEPDVPDNDEVEFVWGMSWLLDGFATTIVDRTSAPEPRPEPAALSPQQALKRAEQDLADGVARRKAAQQRVKELERREAALHKARESARAAVKAARS